MAEAGQVAITKACRVLAECVFADLADIGRDCPGVTRDAYGAGEQRAHDRVRRAAGELELACEVDAAGNLYMTLAGADRALPRWIVGSHLDSVPHGGNYDGAAGVIAGLVAVRAILDSGRLTRRDVTVMAIRAEESTWFPASYIGSRAAFGKLPALVLELPRRDTGRTLRAHMEDLGLRPAAVAAGAAHLDPRVVHGFLEVHIEQGPVLELEGVPVGLVTGVAGSFRYRQMSCFGADGHSGAVARRFRSDAVFAVSDLIQALDRLWGEMEANGQASTITVGELGTDPDRHAFSKVPSVARFCLDVRSVEVANLERIHAALLAAIAGIEASRGVRFDLGERTGSAPATLDPRLRSWLAALARARGIATLTLPSGAGHDAATFAGQGVPSALLFVRNQNGSHNPDEAMRMEDLLCAAGLVADCLLDG